MKKIIILFIAGVMTVFAASCSSEKTTVNNEQPDVTENETVMQEDGVVYSYHSLNSPEDAYNNGVYPVSFDPEKDIEKSGSTYNVTFTLYEYDLYNSDDISALDVGSEIQMNETIHTVETIERDEETGTVVINGGRENGGFVLLAQTFEYRTDNEENNCPYLYPIGEITLPLAEDFTYTDNNKPAADGKGTKTDLSAFPASLDKSGFGYIPENTAIEVLDGKVAQLIKYVLE